MTIATPPATPVKSATRPAAKAPAKAPAKKAVKAPVKASAKAAVEPAKKSSAKAPANVAPKAPTPAAAPASAKSAAKPVKAEKPAKVARIKLVRDGFTMPADDFALIAALKARALAAKREVKKSELLRAGLQVLAALNDAGLVAALGRLTPVKQGRPKKGR